MLKNFLLILFIAFAFSVSTNCKSNIITVGNQSANNNNSLDVNSLDNQCHDLPVCRADCGLVVPGCTKTFFAGVEKSGLVQGHYFQHACLYRWGETGSTSWIFSLIQGYYRQLVTNYQYPTLTFTNLQQFEKDTYNVCAGSRKCAGFGLSALLSGYVAFNQKCQENWKKNTQAGLQADLDASRNGNAYGGATGNINYWDANPTLTFQILNGYRSQLDATFTLKVSQNIYDYCPCQTFESFDNFMKANVIPKLPWDGSVYSSNAWYGSSTQSVNIASGYYPLWRTWNPTLTTNIANIKTRCRQICRSAATVQEVDEEILENSDDLILEHSE